MSSMFKKKGGLAFKPKIPSARPRPTPASTPASQPSQAVQDEFAPQQIDSELTKTSADAPTSIPPEPAQVEAPVDSNPPPPEPLSPPPTQARVRQHYNRHDEETSEPPQGGASQGGAPQAETISPIPATVQAPLVNGSATLQPTVEETAPTPAIATNTPSGDTQETDQSLPEDELPIEPALARPTPKKTTKPRAPKSRSKKPVIQTPKSGESSTPQPKKRQRKAPVDGEAAETQPAARKRRARSSTDVEPKPRRARSPTPEGAETQTVDLTTLKMSDLTRDLQIGRKFSRHDELRERERQRRAKFKLAKSGVTGEAEGEEGEDGQSASNNGKEQEKAGVSSSASNSGPQFRIVDGQIVIDQSSLVMDRHARAAAAQGDMETIEENDFTRLTTSNSYMNTSKLRGPNVWVAAETELFYRGLRMFGTDFEMISQMFPNKQRRHVKLKYNREERHNPQLISSAVVGEKTIRMDLDEYKTFTGTEYESVESIEAEQRKIQEGFEAEQQRIIDEQAEVMRKKREELFADNDDQNAKKKKKGKKSKQTIEYGLDGNPIVRDEQTIGS